MHRLLPRFGVGLLILAAGAVSRVQAQDTVFTLAPEKTTVAFTLGASFHTVHGTFRVKRGAVRFDPSTGKASGQVIVDATSGDTGNGKRDRTMHREVLQSERYPDIIFSATEVAGSIMPAGESRVRLEGVLRLQDRDHPVTLEVHIQPSGNEVRATAQLVVPYVAWGLKNPSNIFLHVADKVNLSIDTSGTLATAGTTTDRR